MAAVADRPELSKNHAKRTLDAPEDVVQKEEVGNTQKVRIGGPVPLTVRVKPANKARKGRNPATRAIRKYGLNWVEGAGRLLAKLCIAMARARLKTD